MAITTADIHAAADALAAQGKRATLAAVRAALGGGSFSTIGDALKTWRAPVVQEPQDQAVPEALTDGAARMAAALWVQATEQAQQGIAAARRELEQQRTALEAQRQEAVEAADALAAQLADTRQELETTRKGMEALRTELAATCERLAAATERAQQAESHAAQAKEAEMAARVDAAGLSATLKCKEEELRKAQEQGLGSKKTDTTAQAQGAGRKKADMPIQGSLEVG